MADVSSSTKRYSHSRARVSNRSKRSDNYRRMAGATMNGNTTLMMNSKPPTYPFVQRHGQRTYGPPEWWVGPPPRKGSEIFVGKLPKNLTEEELQALVPVFEKIGPVYEMRLLMQFSQQNRGFAFVKYGCPDHAERAVVKLNGFQVRPGKRLGVIKSVEHCKIEIEDMPMDKGSSEILEELKKWTKGVVKIEVDRKGGVVVVEYESHFDAGVARRELLFQAKPFGVSLQEVYWAAQPNELPTLFVNNIPLSASEDQLRQLFSSNGLSYVDKMRNRSYAFVRYLTKEDAESAMKKLDGFLIDGHTIEAQWAKRSTLGKSVKYIRGRKNMREEASPFAIEKMLGSPWLDDPIMLLKNICVESGFQEPYYTVTYNDCTSFGSPRSYTSLVFLPHLQYPLNPLPVQNEGFRTPEMAKAFAAISVLKRIGYDYNFGFNFPSQQVFSPQNHLFFTPPCETATFLPPSLSLLPPNISLNSRPLNSIEERIGSHLDFSCPPLLKEETPSMDLLAEAVALARDFKQLNINYQNNS